MTDPIERPCKRLPFDGVWEPVSEDKFDELLNAPGVVPVDSGFVVTPMGNRSKTRYSEFSDGKSIAVRIEQGPTRRRLFSFTRILYGD